MALERHRCPKEVGLLVNRLDWRRETEGEGVVRRQETSRRAWGLLYIQHKWPGCDHKSIFGRQCGPRDRDWALGLLFCAKGSSAFTMVRQQRCFCGSPCPLEGVNVFYKKMCGQRIQTRLTSWSCLYSKLIFTRKKANLLEAFD